MDFKTREMQILSECYYLKNMVQYFTDKIFKEFGYQGLLNSLYKEEADKYIPCEDFTHQCHLNCYMKGNCKYAEDRVAPEEPARPQALKDYV